MVSFDPVYFVMRKTLLFEECINHDHNFLECDNSLFPSDSFEQVLYLERALFWYFGTFVLSFSFDSPASEERPRQ